MTDLMALAERVEVIDPTTDCDWTGIHSLNEAICAANTPPDGVRTVIPPDYLRSLDAAMTLVPDKSMWSVCDMEEGPFAQIIRPMPNGGYLGGLMQSHAATPALALTAAALRAIAAQENTQ